MKYLKFVVFIGVPICLNSIPQLTFAQSGGNFEIKQSVIASGGGNGAGGAFSLDGTIGQTAEGTTSSGISFAVISGFWGGGAAGVALQDAPFDFDGDGKTDLSIFRPTVGEWWYLKSSNGGNYAAQFGVSSDKIMPGDYTGDGKTDIAIWRPSNGNWFVLRSEDLSFYSFPFGTSGDTPSPGDYDGDGKTDAAVFRPSDTNWYVNKSTGGTIIRQFGNAGDKPVPSAFIP